MTAAEPLDLAAVRRGRQIRWTGPGGVLEIAAGIVNSYQTGVTLRQLFYRLVAVGLIPNSESAYKGLSRNSAEARREGWFPALVDQTRGIQRALSWDGPDDALSWLAARYRLDRTKGQQYAVYLGVEKGALSSLLWAWFSNRGLPVFALRGYSSQTLADEVVRDASRDGRPAVLLYAGDFDPSGEDISRDFEDRAECFDEVRLVALSAEQVVQYNLPPYPGKSTDSRAGAFVARHGRLVQVELDALPPDELRRLYEEALADYWDQDAYEAVCRRESAVLDALDQAAEIVAGELAADDDGTEAP
jgi:hypothetical protein